MGIVVVCISDMNVHRVSNRRRRGVDLSAQSIWEVCFAV